MSLYICKWTHYYITANYLWCVLPFLVSAGLVNISSCLCSLCDHCCASCYLGSDDSAKSMQNTVLVTLCWGHTSFVIILLNSCGKVNNLGRNLGFAFYLLRLFPPLLPWLIFHNLLERSQDVFQLWPQLVPAEAGEGALFTIGLIWWITCRFWVSSASLKVLWTSFSPCDIIAALSSMMSSLISCSVALGHQRWAVTLLAKPLAFWAKAKADGVSSSSRPDGQRESYLCSKDCGYVRCGWAPEDYWPWGWMQ